MPKVAMRKRPGMEGAFDEAAGLMNPLSLPGSLGMMIVKNPQMRKIIHDELRQGIAGFGKNAAKGLEYFIKKYPRLMGHVTGIGSVPLTNPKVVSAWQPGTMPSPSALGKIANDLTISPEELTKLGAVAGGIQLRKSGLHAARSLKGLTDSLGHEAAHQAQALRMGSTEILNRAYNRMEAAHGYRRNPLEVAAREAGSNAASRLKAMSSPYSLEAGMRDLLRIARRGKPIL